MISVSHKFENVVGRVRSISYSTHPSPRWRQQYKPVHGHDVGGRVAAMPCLEIHSLLHGPRACGGRQEAGKRSWRRP